MRRRLLVIAGLVLLLPPALGPYRAEGCSLLGAAPHACCGAQPPPPSPAAAGTCCDGGGVELTTPVSHPPSFGSLVSECSCWHAPATPPGQLTGAATPLAPELELQLAASSHGPRPSGCGVLWKARTAPPSSTHDPLLFLIGCALLI